MKITYHCHHHHQKIYKSIQHILMSITAKSCRYDVNGFVEELPQLPENRALHACAALPITKVRQKQNQPFVQAFIVAGGYTSWFTSSVVEETSSVVTLLHGATAWTPLASLPRVLWGARASIVGGRIRINGGYDGVSYRSEVRIEKW